MNDMHSIFEYGCLTREQKATSIGLKRRLEEGNASCNNFHLVEVQLHTNSIIVMIEIMMKNIIMMN